MSFDINNPYFRTKVLTANPEELRLMLLEGCLGFMRDGHAGLVGKDWEAMYDGFSQAKAILLELINTMQPEHAPEVCAKLSGVYTYVYSCLTDGSFAKDPTKVVEAIELIEYDRDTWVLLMEKLTRERADGSAAIDKDVVGRVRTANPAATPGATGTDGYTPLSVEG